MASKFELHRHHKIFLIFAGVIFAGAGTGSWFTWKSCQELEEKAQLVNDQVTAAKQKIATIEDLEKGVIVLRENVQNYVRVLPSDAEVEVFLRKIEDFRRDSGVEISEVRKQPTRTKLASSAVFERQEYRVAITGTYLQFLQFISRLENYERFISLSTIRITAGQANDRDKSGTTEIQHKFELHGRDLPLHRRGHGQGGHDPRLRPQSAKGSPSRSSRRRTAWRSRSSTSSPRRRAAIRSSTRAPARARTARATAPASRSSARPSAGSSRASRSATSCST